MKLSILHISDLHRNADAPIGNDALLDSLENDRRRYTAGRGSTIRSPDLIVISGDIVHGVPPDAPDADEELERQYGEALDFLNRLTERLLHGNKDRVVVVPGNHDMSSAHFVKSLQPIDVPPDRKNKKELAEQLFSQNSTLRWSWSDFSLYKIVNPDLYLRRLEAFSDFYQQFFESRRTYPLDPSKQFDVFDIPEFELTFVGFCSCYNNDIFNRQGNIHPDCIANAGMTLCEPQYKDRLRIAVWHHTTEGRPLQSDYVDSDFLHNLIERGFSIGFHGHQHRPQFLDTLSRHGGHWRITVISAGTLCGCSSPRFGPAYNIVELDTERRTGLLHVREMQNENLQSPIWGQRSLPPNSDICVTFQFDPPQDIRYGPNAYDRLQPDLW